MLGTTALVGVTGMAQAQDWNVVGGGDWNVAGNWNPAVVPDSSLSTVDLVSNGGSGNIDLGGGSFDVGTLDVNGDYRIVNGQLTLFNPVNVNVQTTQPFFSNTVALVLGADVFLTSATDNISNATISGAGFNTLRVGTTAGTLTMNGVMQDGGTTLNVLVQTGTVRTTAVNTYTGGTGVLTGATLIQNGTIGDVTVNAGASMTNNGTAGAVTTSGSVLNAGTMASVIVNGDTTIVGPTGEITGSSTVNNGSLRNLGTVAGVDVQPLGTFDNRNVAGDVTNQGTVTNSGAIASLIQNGATATTSVGDAGQITGASTINGGTLTNFGSVGDVSVAAGASFSQNLGADALASAGNVTNSGTVSAAGTLASLTQDAGLTVIRTNGEVTGSSTVNAGTMLNRGTVADVAVASGAVLFNRNTAGDVTNSGTVRNSGAMDSLSQSGATAMTEVEDGGQITGTSAIDGGLLTNFGAVGAVSVASGARFNQRLGGDAAASAGAVSNSGLVSVEGTIASLTQAAGQTTVLAAGQITGASDVNGGALINAGQVASVDVAAGAQFTNQALANAGQVQNAGLVTNAGTIATLSQSGSALAFTLNTGTINGATATIDSGTLRNFGTVTDVDLASGTILLNEAGGAADAVTNDGGAVTNSGIIDSLTQLAGTTKVNVGGSITNATVIDGGTLSNFGTLSSVDLATGTLFSNFGAAGLVTNAGGTMNNAGVVAALSQSAGSSIVLAGASITGASLVNGGLLTNLGTVDTVDVGISGEFRNATGATASNVTNAGTLVNSGMMTGTLVQSLGSASVTPTGVIIGSVTINGGALSNAGTTGAIALDFGTTLDQTGTSGAIDNNGTATLGSGATVNGNLTNAGTASLTGATVNGLISNTGLLALSGTTVTGNVSNSGTASFAGSTLGGNLTSTTAIDILAGTTSVAGNLTSPVSLDMGDGSPTGILNVAGNSTTNGSITIDLNQTTGATDLINVGAFASGTATLNVVAAPSTNPTAADITVLTFGDATSDVALTFNDVNSSFSTSSTLLTALVKDPNAYVLKKFENPAIGALTSGVVLTQSLIGTVVNRPSSAFVTPLANTEDDPCSTGTWARATGGAAELKGSTTNSLGDTYRTELDADYAGFQMGIDRSCFDGYYNGYDITIGAMAGFNNGKTSQPVFRYDIATNTMDYDTVTSVTDTEFEQAYGGVYLTAARDGWFGDLQYRFESTTYDVENTARGAAAPLGLLKQKYKSTGHTVSGTLGYQYVLSEAAGIYMVPQGGFSFSRLKVDPIGFQNGGTLKIEDITQKIAFGSLLLGKQQVLPSGTAALNYFGVATVYKDFTDEIKSTYTQGTRKLTSTNSTLDTFGEVSLGVNYTRILDDGSALPARQLDITGRVDSRFSDRLDSWGLTAQVRLQF
ncbi:hypothetical protein KB874_05285 [Aestuariicoccus sp. KMU-90]|uniref:Autotransporter domain-containing protein n=2 Tax=Thetidibacter halocola TaxID=2827239 RepID=A0A8J8B7H1_9RHOB|nr:hypothetical protein [Thetidibacter halocola]